MSTPLKIILIILLILTIISGLHFVRRTFGVGPELYVPIGWMTRLGIFPEELIANPPDHDSSVVADSPAPTQPAVFKAPVGAVMVIPLDLDALSTDSMSDQLEWDASISGKPDQKDASGATASLEVNQQATQSAKSAENVESTHSYNVRLTFIKEIQPAGVILFGSKIDAKTAKQAIDEIRSVSPNTLVMVDHEGGAVQRLSGEGFTTLPSWRAQCSLSQEQLEESVASAASELAKVGVDVVLGPVADLSGGFLGNRTCSADPLVISKYSQSVIDTYASQGIASVVKHFPGIGGVARDLHDSPALATIRERDLEPFSRILENNQELATMVSFIRVAQADESNPCALSQYCLREFSKRFPRSLLISDALEMESAAFIELSSSELPGSTSPGSEPQSSDLHNDLSSQGGTEGIIMVADGKATLSGRSIRALEAGIDLLLYGPSVTTSELQRVVEDLQARYTSSNTMVVQFADAEKRVNHWKITQ